MSKEREILRSGAWYLIGNILVKAIAFIALPIFTNIMSTEAFGIFGTYQAYETVFSVLICLGVSGTVRAAYHDFKEDFDRYVSAITVPLMAMSGLWLVAVGVYYAVTGNTTIGAMGVALVLNCLGNALREVFASRMVIQNQYKKNLLMSLAMSVLNIGISYYLCITVFSDQRHFGRIWGTVLASCLVALVLLIAQLKNSRKVFWPKAWKFGYCVGIPLILHQLSLSLLGQCDKIMIEGMVGAAQAGIYNAMITIILVPQVIMSSIDNAWAPWFYNNKERDSDPAVRKEIQTLNHKLVILFALIMVGFQLLCREVLQIMVAPEYRSGIDVLYVLSVSVFANFLYLFSVNTEYFHKKTGKISLYTLITALLNLALNYMGIRLFGYLGAAVATLLSRVTLLMLHARQAKKLCGYDPVRVPYLAGALAAVSASAYLVHLIEDMTVLRLGAAVLIAIFGVKYLYKNFHKV